MSALPPFRQIQFNQIPGAPAWFAAFLTSLNQFLGAVYDSLNRGTTLTDNIPAQIKTLSVQIANDGTFSKLSFAVTLKTKPQIVLLAQAALRSGSAAPYIALVDSSNVALTNKNKQLLCQPAISLNQWAVNGGMVSIDSIVGLAAGNTYDLTFLVL